MSAVTLFFSLSFLVVCAGVWERERDGMLARMHANTNFSYRNDALYVSFCFLQDNNDDVAMNRK